MNGPIEMNNSHNISVDDVENVKIVETATHVEQPHTSSSKLQPQEEQLQDGNLQQEQLQPYQAEVRQEIPQQVEAQQQATSTIHSLESSVYEVKFNTLGSENEKSISPTSYSENMSTESVSSEQMETVDNEKVQLPENDIGSFQKEEMASDSGEEVSKNINTLNIAKADSTIIQDIAKSTVENVENTVIDAAMDSSVTKSEKYIEENPNILSLEAENSDDVIGNSSESSQNIPNEYVNSSTSLFENLSDSPNGDDSNIENLSGVENNLQDATKNIDIENNELEDGMDFEDIEAGDTVENALADNDDPTFEIVDEDGINDFDDDQTFDPSIERKKTTSKIPKKKKSESKESKKRSLNEKEARSTKKKSSKRKNNDDESVDSEYEGIVMFSALKELDRGTYRLLSQGIEEYAPPSYHNYEQLQSFDESSFVLQEKLEEEQILERLKGMWEMAYICYICKVLRPLLKFMHFDPSQLERAFIYPDTKESADLLADLHIRLSKGPVIDKRSREILLDPSNGQWVSVLKNKLDYIQQNTPYAIFWNVNPLKSCSYSQLSPFIRVLLLKSLCDWKLLTKTQRFLDLLKKIEDPNELRIQPLAYSKSGSIYWYFGPEVGRLYVERHPKLKAGNEMRPGKWKVVCETTSDFENFAKKHKDTDDPGIRIVLDNIERYIIQDINAYQEEKDRRQKERRLKIEEKLRARELELEQQEQDQETIDQSLEEDSKIEDSTEELKQKLRVERAERKKAREEQKRLMLLQEEQGGSYQLRGNRLREDDIEGEYPNKKRKKNDDDEFIPDDFDEEESEDDDDDLYEEEEIDFEEEQTTRRGPKKIQKGNQGSMFGQFQIYQPNQHKKGTFVPLSGFPFPQSLQLQGVSGSQQIHPLPPAVFARLSQSMSRNQQNAPGSMQNVNPFLNQQRISQQNFQPQSNFMGNVQKLSNNQNLFLGGTPYNMHQNSSAGLNQQNSLSQSPIQQGLSQNTSPLQGDQNRNYFQHMFPNPNQQVTNFPFGIPSFGNNIPPKGNMMNQHMHPGLNGNQKFSNTQINQMSPTQINQNQMSPPQMNTSGQMHQNAMPYNQVQQLQMMRQMQRQMASNNFQGSQFHLPQMHQMSHMNTQSQQSQQSQMTQPMQQMNQQQMGQNMGQPLMGGGYNNQFDRNSFNQNTSHNSNMNSHQQTQDDDFF